MNALTKTFAGKTVMLTGHTGFKGSWLTAWLKLLGADVVGIALEPPTKPSHYDVADLGSTIRDWRIDIRDAAQLSDAIVITKPDFVFHLAAQALVRPSYDDPMVTWSTNLMGTLNLLEGLRRLDNSCVAVIITSDKCYDNVEWVWGYRETDGLGGPDPYSASKGAAEVAIRSHIKSFFPKDGKVRIASARAGNVIGGGDWAADRIVPDCIRAWSASKSVELRSPHATRPWQHVLEPLSGYLNLAMTVNHDSSLHGEPFNFGPPSHQNHSVLELVREMSLHWDQVLWDDVSKSTQGPYESRLLKLNCDKALHFLQWQAVMDFTDTVRLTAEWYRAFYSHPSSISEMTRSQIQTYTNMAAIKGLQWAS